MEPLVSDCDVIVDDDGDGDADDDEEDEDVEIDGLGVRVRWVAATAASSSFATSTQGTTADNAVPKALYDAQTILQATTDNTPVALTIAEQTVVGRITGGNITALTSAQLSTLLGLGTAATAASSSFLQVANNLSDVTPATARSNLGVLGMVNITRPQGSSVTNTSSITSALSSAITLPALAAGEAFEFMAFGTYLNNTGSGQTPQFSILLGSTVVVTISMGAIGTSGSTRAVTVLGHLYAIGANSSRTNLRADIGPSVSLVQGTGTATEAIQTAGLTFDFRVKHPSATTTQTFQIDSWVSRKVALT